MYFKIHWFLFVQFDGPFVTLQPVILLPLPAGIQQLFFPWKVTW